MWRQLRKKKEREMVGVIFFLPQPSKHRKKGNRGERERMREILRQSGRYSKARRGERERIRQREEGNERERETYCKAKQGVDVSVSQARRRGSRAGALMSYPRGQSRRFDPAH